MKILIACLVLSAGIHHVTPYDAELENGRSQYELLQRDTRMPNYGTCWKKALDELHSGCRALTDDVQARLGLSFANCFLIKSGQKSYECKPETPVSECIRDISTNAFTAYSNFFAHTQNMCQFLQAQVWREKTEETILTLSERSAKVSESISESSKIQDTIVRNQLETLEYQKQIAANGSILSHAIETSKTNVKEMLQEFRSSTDEQKMLIFSIFDRVSKLQNLVISEVSWLYTMLFYGVAMLVLYLVTAAKRTAEARIPIFCVLTANFLLERTICNWSLPDENDFGESDEISENINARIWMLRKMSLLIALIILMYFAATFQDYNLINHQLLQDICRQNRELYSAMDLLKKLQQNHDHTDFSISKRDDVENEEDGWESDSNSFDSTKTDRTWMSEVFEVAADDFSDDEEDDNVAEDFSFLEQDFFTATNNSPSDSGNSTPTNKDSKRDDLSAPTNNQQDQLVVLNGSCHGLLVSTDQQDSSLKKLKGSRGPSRRGGFSEDGSRPGTPSHSYNLRRRAANSTFENSILESESPNSFGKLVSQLNHITQKNSLLIREKFRQLKVSDENSASNSVAVFSSDEEN